MAIDLLQHKLTELETELKWVKKLIWIGVPSAFGFILIVMGIFFGITQSNMPDRIEQALDNLAVSNAIDRIEKADKDVATWSKSILANRQQATDALSAISNQEQSALMVEAKLSEIESLAKERASEIADSYETYSTFISDIENTAALLSQTQENLLQTSSLLDDATVLLGKLETLKATGESSVSNIVEFEALITNGADQFRNMEEGVLDLEAQIEKLSHSIEDTVESLIPISDYLETYYAVSEHLTPEVEALMVDYKINGEYTLYIGGSRSEAFLLAKYTRECGFVTEHFSGIIVTAHTKKEMGCDVLIRYGPHAKDKAQTISDMVNVAYKQVGLNKPIVNVVPLAYLDKDTDLKHITVDWYP